MRYTTIVHPFGRKWSKKFCGLIVILSLVFVSILKISFATVWEELRGISLVHFAENKTKITIWFATKFFVMYVSPFIILAIIYRLISNHLRMNTNEATRRIQNQPEIEARNKTTLKILKFLSLAAFLTIVPMRLATIVLYAIDFYVCLNPKLNLISTPVNSVANILAISNSSVNVFIYAYAMSDFRQFLINLLKCGRKATRPTERNVERVELQTKSSNIVQ